MRRRHDRPPDREERGAGDLVTEIARLTERNRVDPDGDVEAKLIELRRDAFQAVSPTSPTRQRRPGRDRRLRAMGAVPEVDAADLTAELLRSSIAHRGYLVVRGLLSEDRVSGLIEDIDRAFDAYDAFASGSPVSDTAPWCVPFDPGPGHSIPRDWGRAGGAILAADSPRAMFHVLEAFEDIGIREVVSDYFSEAPVMLANKWTLRRISPNELHPDWHPTRGPDWHQDGAFMGKEVRSLDLWVSLSDCGEDAPGLEIVNRRLRDIVETGTEGAQFGWSVGWGLVDALGDDAIVSPVFRPGDGIFFDHLLLHRTGLQAGMTRDRYAIEAWFATQSAYPADQIPIAY